MKKTILLALFLMFSVLVSAQQPIKISPDRSDGKELKIEVKQNVINMNTTVSDLYEFQTRQMYVNNRVQQSPVVYASPQGVWSDNNNGLSTIVIFSENKNRFMTTTPITFTMLQTQMNNRLLRSLNIY